MSDTPLPHDLDAILDAIVEKKAAWSPVVR
jgi:hypothetical protein